MQPSLREDFGEIPSSSHAIDVHVGRRIRALRKAAGLRQVDLAGHLGISFQQLQKYETAKNRISAATLHILCRVLRTKPDAVFEGLDIDVRKPVRHIEPEMSC